MEIRFKKMQGAGNDFIVFKYEDFPHESLFNQLALQVCDRHFGLGADGILVVGKSESADTKMHYYNSDGSLAKMCGNGLRCFAKYVYDEGLVGKEEFTVETLDGMKLINVNPHNGKAKTIRANMGKMTFEPKKIPVNHGGADFINQEIEVKGKKYTLSTVLMGVPHTIIFTESLDIETIKEVGPLLEKHEKFPEKTNVNFATVLHAKKIKVRTWERGAGYTLACGTGITSVFGVAHYLGLVEDEVEVEADGGLLKISLCDDGTMNMEGPAEDIAIGVYFAKL